MANPPPHPPSDLRGLGRAALDAVAGWLGRVEALGGGVEGRQAGLNGVLGDLLETRGDPRAITMRLRRGGMALPLDREALAAALPRAGSRLLVLAHGLCMNDLMWDRGSHDHGAALERDLGYTAVHLHYNSGRHISVNGRDCADALEALVGAWPAPVSELVLLGYSMGGLVFRSAWQRGAAAAHAWTRRPAKLVFLATPHLGAPMARAGHWLDLVLGATPGTSTLARLGRLRSAGITDLRYGSLLDEDWRGRDRFANPGVRPAPLPLPEGVASYALAATTGRRQGDFKDNLMGDGLVPLASALGRDPDPGRALGFPEHRQWIGYQMNHLDVLSRPEVYAQLRAWIGEG